MLEKVIDTAAIIASILLVLYFYIPLIATASAGQILLLIGYGICYAYAGYKLSRSLRD